MAIGSLMVGVSFSVVSFYVQALKYHQNAVTFAVTLCWVTISYFLFHSHFGNQLVIWSVALLTGCVASLPTIKVLTPSKKSYLFVTPDRWLTWKSGKLGRQFEKMLNEPHRLLTNLVDRFMEKTKTATKFWAICREVTVGF